MSGDNDKYPIVVKQMTDEEIKQYHRNKIRKLSNISELKKLSEPEIKELEELKDELDQQQQTIEQQLKSKYHFKSMIDNEEIWYYDNTKGIYLNNANWLIKKECIRYDPDIKTNNVNDIVNRIIWSNYTNRNEFDKNIEWICCKNVMVNLLIGETKDHSPNNMATIQIPQTYLKLHKTPHIPTPQKILKFLHEVMPSYDDVETVLDYLAYCLWRGFPFHKWLIFTGSGRNGKGVTTELITRFLGHDNVSNEELDRILENNFATANLYGRLANIDADLSSETLKKTGKLKKLSGNDWIIAEQKFKTAFQFKNCAKLIFSANKMPITPDESDAYFARIIMISFPNQYIGENADPYLIDKLATAEEMSLLFSLLIKRLPRVLKNGISTKKTDDIIQDNYIKYKESSDPIG
jgi:putative DNA primase/helicase